MTSAACLEHGKRADGEELAALHHDADWHLARNAVRSEHCGKVLGVAVKLRVGQLFIFKTDGNAVGMQRRLLSEQVDHGERTVKCQRVVVGGAVKRFFTLTAENKFVQAFAGKHSFENVDVKLSKVFHRFRKVQIGAVFKGKRVIVLAFQHVEREL